MNIYLVIAIATINAALGLWYCTGLALLKVSRINYFSLWQRRIVMFRPFALVTSGFGTSYLFSVISGYHDRVILLAIAMLLSFAASPLFRRAERALHL